MQNKKQKNQWIYDACDFKTYNQYGQNHVEWSSGHQGIWGKNKYKTITINLFLSSVACPLKITYCSFQMMEIFVKLNRWFLIS